MLKTARAAKKRKVFFPTGIISLIFLPLFCLVYFYYHHSFQKYSVLELNYLGSKSLRKMNPRFRPVLPQREFHRIELTGDTQVDRVKLDYVQVYIREIVARKDTVHGIHLVLKDEVKYTNLVRAIDIPYIEKLEQWWMNEKGIWYFEIPKSSFDTLTNGLSHCIVLPETAPIGQSWFQLVIEQVSILKQTPYLVISFIVLTIISLLRLPTTSFPND